MGEDKQQDLAERKAAERELVWEKIVMAHWSKLKAIIRKCRQKFPKAAVCTEELMNVAVEALWEASKIESYDPHRGDLVAYAYPKIRGEVSNYLWQECYGGKPEIAERLKELACRVKKAQDRLLQSEDTKILEDQDLLDEVRRDPRWQNISDDDIFLARDWLTLQGKSFEEYMTEETLDDDLDSAIDADEQSPGYKENELMSVDASQEMDGDDKECLASPQLSDAEQEAWEQRNPSERDAIRKKLQQQKLKGNERTALCKGKKKLKAILGRSNPNTKQVQSGQEGE
jgi:hypothetical protein